MSYSFSKGIQNLLNSIPWRDIKPKTLGNIGIAASFLGIGVLFRQPRINHLTESNKNRQIEIENLQKLVKGYHINFVRMQAKLDCLQAQKNIEQAKKVIHNQKAAIMYQYAVKEYIEIYLRPRNAEGVLVLSENEYTFYQVFKRVLNGDQLNTNEEKIVQKYIYPKYVKEIENGVEYNFDDLLARLS